jgi:hypothetical protein
MCFLRAYKEYIISCSTRMDAASSEAYFYARNLQLSTQSTQSKHSNKETYRKARKVTNQCARRNPRSLMDSQINPITFAFTRPTAHICHYDTQAPSPPSPFCTPDARLQFTDPIPVERGSRFQPGNSERPLVEERIAFCFELSTRTISDLARLPQRHDEGIPSTRQFGRGRSVRNAEDLRRRRIARPSECLRRDLSPAHEAFGLNILSKFRSSTTKVVYHKLHNWFVCSIIQGTGIASPSIRHFI